MNLFLLRHVSAPLLALLFMAVATAVALGGLLFVRRRFSPEAVQNQNETAAVLIAIVGGIYGVLLAFIVAIAWQQFQDASGVADREAVLVLSLYRDAGRFPAQAGLLRAGIESYARHVIDDEWADMAAQRGDSRAVDEALNGLERDIAEVELRTPQETPLYSDFISRLGELEQVRQDRLSAAGSSLPGPMWWVLIGGGLVTVMFTYFFGVSSLRAHMFMVGTIAATIGLTLFLIASLDLPFTGGVAVQPSTLRAAVAEFPHLAS